MSVAVSGLADGDSLTLTLGSAGTVDGFLAARTVVGGPGARARVVTFDGVNASLAYWLKHEGVGYAAPPAEELPVPAPRSLARSVHLLAASERHRRRLRRLLGDEDDSGVEFSYHWSADASRAGAAETAYRVQPPEIFFVDEEQPVRLGDDAATDKLLREHRVLLADATEESVGYEFLPWSSEYAWRLLQTLDAINAHQSGYLSTPWRTSLNQSKWELVQDALIDDVQIEEVPAEGGREGGVRVRISAAAFVLADPQVVLLDGVRGKFFSRRLYHAAVRVMTLDGADLSLIESIADRRFGLSIASASTPNSTYVSLTSGITDDTAAAFQPFETHPEEVLLLLEMLEELPSGFHVVPGFDWCLRRKDGYPHPLYPLAPAVAWTGRGYVEFMESGFRSDIRHLRRLILHEKAHFMWSHLFSEGLRANWTTLGGWFVDPNATSGWSTTEQTTFVTAYAHEKNPDEDMVRCKAAHSHAIAAHALR